MEFLYSALNFPEAHSITINEVLHGTPTVGSRLRYFDGYRKYRSDDRVLYWANPGWQGSVFLPQEIGRFNAGWRFRYSETHTNFSNQEDITAMQAAGEKSNRNFALHFALTDGTAMLGAGFDIQRSNAHSPATVKRYPQSENPRINRYFYDWLPLAFGRQLRIESNGNGFRPTIFADLPTGMGGRISLQYRFSARQSTPMIIYSNHSNKSELRGRRRISFPSEGLLHFLRIGYTKPDNPCAISIDVFRSGFSTEVDNHPPDTKPIPLDFTSLGEAELQRTGANIRWEQDFKPIALGMGVGYSDIAGSFAVTTPVLGYYDDLFPISHGVSGTVGGTVFSQDVQVQWETELLGLRFAPDIRYTHAYADFKVDGTAELEFNLASEKVRQPLQSNIHLMQAAVRIEKRWSGIHLGYDVSQTVPSVQRADSGDIKTGQPRRPSELSHKGGLSHSIFINYVM